MKKRRKAILALICTAALLAGCSGSGDSGTKAAKDQQKETQSSEKENTDGREEGTEGEERQKLR